ncbi:MAG: NAD-dependent dehydratase [Legionellales bacterium]|nr:NAD-dependent dehydratase [Legionellales bacterium]|tara:strand:+ start:2412 stop:3350 length:939 start_codon:yes stop_codon:yes gene_type:complete
MKKFLVTGGDGFIGTGICEMLSNNNIAVTSIDNRSRNKKFNINNSYKSINCDITKMESLMKIPGTFDAIVHLAFINGTKYFYEKPDEVMKVGIIGTYNIINYAQKKKIKNFYISSSSEVYQKPNNLPTNENEIMKVPDAYNPRYSYGASKIITELMSIHFGKKIFKKMVIFRPHNVYGPNMGNEHVIPEIINKIKYAIKNKKKYIKVQGTGNETRSFNYIDDFVQGVSILLKSKLKFETFNIGNNDEIKIDKLIKIIMRIMNVKLKIKYGNLRVGSTSRRCPDITKIKKLGYTQKIFLEEGLRKTIDWYIKN